MTNNKLLWINTLEINRDLVDSKEKLKLYIDYPPKDDSDLDDWILNIARLRKRILSLEEKLEDIDDDRCYLIDELGNEIIDFWKVYDSNRVNQIMLKNEHLIEIAYEDSNGKDCLTVIDFQGNEVVPSCIEYDEIGNHIKMVRYGYMIGHFRDFDLFSTLVDSDIVGNQIDYISEFDVYEVDETRIYDNNFEFLGEKIINGDDSLSIKNESSLNVLLMNGMKFEIEHTAKNITTFYINEISVVIYKVEHFVKLILVSLNKDQKDYFNFDRIYVINSISETIIVGINNANNTTESYSFYSEAMTIDGIDEPVYFQRQTFNQVITIDPILFSLLDIQVID